MRFLPEEQAREERVRRFCRDFNAEVVRAPYPLSNWFVDHPRTLLFGRLRVIFSEIYPTAHALQRADIPSSTWPDFEEPKEVAAVIAFEQGTWCFHSPHCQLYLLVQEFADFEAAFKLAQWIGGAPTTLVLTRRALHVPAY